MVKKEIAEIKKTLRPESNSFTMLCGCYVHGEDRERTTFKTAFQSLQEEDFFKYLDVFKKTLSGSIGKTLFNVPLSREQQELQELLYELVTGGCKDDDKLNEFYERVTGAIETQENFVIFLAHNRYDVPGKTSDDLEMDDASEEVFSYILCAVCPVSLTEPGLGYSEECGTFESMVRNWTAHNRITAFYSRLLMIVRQTSMRCCFITAASRALATRQFLTSPETGFQWRQKSRRTRSAKLLKTCSRGNSITAWQWP